MQMLMGIILINTNSLGDLIYSHGLKYHLYSEKFQIYISSADLSLEIQTKYPIVYSISPLGYLKAFQIDHLQDELLIPPLSLLVQFALPHLS